MDHNKDAINLLKIIKKVDVALPYFLHFCAAFPRLHLGGINFSEHFEERKILTRK